MWVNLEPKGKLHIKVRGVIADEITNGCLFNSVTSALWNERCLGNLIGKSGKHVDWRTKVFFKVASRPKTNQMYNLPIISAVFCFKEKVKEKDLQSNIFLYVRFTVWLSIK